MGDLLKFHAKTTHLAPYYKQYAELCRDRRERFGPIPTLSLRKGVQKRLEKTGDAVHYVAENIERLQALDAAHNRTREEWAEMERTYYLHGVFKSLEDIFDDVKPLIDREKERYDRLVAQSHEAGHDSSDLINASLSRIWKMCDDFDRNNSGYRKCEYVFCHGYFEPKRKAQRFCCEYHRQEQKNAERRYHQTAQKFRAGTFLPEHAYIPKRFDSVEGAYRGNETVENGMLNSVLYGFDAIDEKTGVEIEQISFRNVRKVG